MINANLYGNILEPIDLISTIVNIILFYIVVNISRLIQDLRFVMLIGIIELMSPLISISDIIATVMREDDTVNVPKLCQYLGLFTVLLILCQFIGSTSLVSERLNIATEINYIKCTIIPATLSL
ncbi:hypothetical protein K502DRAFT_364955, partial [Neoconidiobolus thromboides FSU 785]